MKRFGWVRVFVLCALCSNVFAQNGYVETFSELQAVVDQSWTNSFMDVMYPPGMTYTNSAGVLVVSSNFPSTFLSALLPSDRDGVDVYPVLISETNDLVTTRAWKASDGLVVTNSSAPAEYDADAWVTDRYPPPDYLTSEELASFIAARRLDRKTARYELLKIEDFPAYQAAISNRIAQTSASIASNRIGTLGIKLLPEIPALEMWVQVPEGIDYVGIYKTQSMLDPQVWEPYGTVMASESPTWVQVALLDSNIVYGGGSGGSGGGIPPIGEGGSTNTNAFVEVTLMEVVRLMDHVTDTDGDGLLDAIEQLVEGTDANNPDSDNDGLSDGEEVNEYDTDPNKSSTDDDSLSDGWEVAHGLNPLDSEGFNGDSGDEDGDGVSNFAEYQQGTHPRVKNVTPPPGALGSLLYVYDDDGRLLEAHYNGLSAGRFSPTPATNLVKIDLQD